MSRKRTATIKSRKRTATIKRRMPEQVIYYTVPGVVSGMGTIGTPIVVSPGGLSDDDLDILFRGKWCVSSTHTTHTQIILPNEPITDTILMAVSWDGKFYIKYQLGDKLYLADIHGESLFEIIETVGIKKGGKIPGSLIWVSTSSNKYMRLMHTEGTQIKQIAYKDDVGSNVKVRKRDLELGVLYETYSGKQGIYLGSVNAIHFPWQSFVWTHELVTWKVVHNSMLWYEIKSPMRSVGKDFREWDINQFYVQSTHSYRKKIRTVITVDQFKWLPKIRKMALLHVVNDITNRLSTHSVLMNIYPKGIEPIISQEVLEFMEHEGYTIILPGTTKEELPRFLTHENKFVRAEAKRYYKHITGSSLK